MSRALLGPALALALLVGTPLVLPSVARADDDDAKALLARGLDSEKTKLEEAVQAYKTLLDKFPNDPLAARAHLRLGIALAKLNKPDEARAHLREARKLGKDDDDVQREAEKALIALPPPAEPQKKAAPAPPPKAAAPVDPEKAALQAEIERLDAELKDYTKRVHDLEDQGKIAEAYQLRPKMDEKAALLDKKRKELAQGPRRPALANKEREKREEKKGEKNDKPERQKLMQRRREDLENAARVALEKAREAFAQNRPQEGQALLAEHAKLLHEAEQVGKRHEGKRAELHDSLEKARAKQAQAEKSGDEAAAKAARDEVAQAEKALRELDASSQDDERAQLERLAADMKKRGAPQFEIDERLALAKREIQLDREHRQEIARLQSEIDEKKIPDGEARDKMGKLDREHHRKIERLREEGETRVHERARAEMEKELARRAEELKKDGVAGPEVEQRIAALRREMEPKLPGKRGDQKLADTGDGAEHPREKKIRELQEENRKLKKRLEELEKELAALREAKGASADAPK